MTATVPPNNVEAETSALGAILLAADNSGKVLGGVMADEGLRAEHFYRPRHGLIFTAMVGLLDRGEAIDAVTVLEALDGDGEDDLRAYVHSLPSLVPAAGNVRHYARIVVEHARLRQFVEAGRAIEAGAMAGDLDAVAEGEALLLPTRRSSGRLTREERQQRIVERVESGGGEKWPWPFDKLNQLSGGGLRRGQFTVLVGHRSHLKSVLLRQVLDKAHQHGATTCLYTNEMTADEIDLRFVARESAIPYLRLVEGSLHEQEWSKFAKAVEQIGKGIEVQPADGWSADEIAHDIKRSGWDVIGVDLLNNVAGGKETKDVDRNVTVLAACSRQADCHIIACNHLNQARQIGHDYPREPVLSDIRQSGQIADLANNVLSVYRFEEEVLGERTGDPGNDAVVRYLKQRGGPLGKVDCNFVSNRMRLDVKHAEPGTVAA